MPTALQPSYSSVLAELYKYSPSAVVELFELDLTPLSEYFTSKGVTISPLKRYFHNGVNKKAQGTIPLSDTDIIWNGVTYSARAINMDGVQASSAGEVPRPTLTINNNDFLFTELCKSYQNLVGAKITRIRTLVKFLDRNNFLVNNLVMNSVYAAASWTLPLGNGTLTAGQTDPFGTTSAVRLTCSGAGNTRLRVALTNSIIANGTDTYTISFYVKKVSGTTGNAVADINDANSYTYLSSLVTGTWVRVSWSTVLTAGTKTLVDLFNDSTSNLVLDFFGLQIQKGATLTDYVWNTTSDPQAKFPDDVYNIDRMSEEVPGQITFELAPAWDVEGVALPRRQILANICPWVYKEDPCSWSVSGVVTTTQAGTAVATTATYSNLTPTTTTGSGSGLVVTVVRAGGTSYAASTTVTILRMGSGYVVGDTVTILGSLLGGVDGTNDMTITIASITGALYYDENDVIATTAANDRCGKRYTSCKIRFGTRVMPFGGFPSAGLYGKPI